MSNLHNGIFRVLAVESGAFCLFFLRTTQSCRTCPPGNGTPIHLMNG
nr:MAG TPA: hypothetical protein [Caudoviricetes sp.]